MKRLLALLVLLLLVGAAFHRERLPALLAGDWGGLGGRVGDARTRASVLAALQLNREVAPWPIEVAAAAGVVALSGRAPSAQVRDGAGRIAAAVPGVREVENRIEIEPALPPPARGARSLGERFDDQ